MNTGIVRVISILGMLASAGCTQPASAPEPAPRPDAEACGASSVRKYLGFVATDELVATIARESGAQKIRRYTTGDPVTLDLVAARLNIEVAVNGRIAVLVCG